MKNKEIKKIPEFASEEQEHEFWATHDSSEYVDWDQAETVTLPRLKPSLKTISIRLPKIMIDDLRLLANKKDVPYQSLMKMFIAERIEQELRK